MTKMTLHGKNDIKPFVSVVIIAKNEEETIEDTLKALYSQRCNVPFEVLVIDGHSSDGTLKKARKFPVRIFFQDKPGMSAARNVGIREAKGEVIAFIDADSFPEENYLCSVAEKFKSNAICAGFGDVKAWGNSVLTLVQQMEHEVWYSKLIEQGYSSVARGCNMIFRKKILNAIGGFDERFRGGDEETVVAEKLRERGIKYHFVEHAAVYHKHPSTLKEYTLTLVRVGRGQAQFYSCYPKYNRLISLKSNLKISKRYHFVLSFFPASLGTSKYSILRGNIRAAFLSLLILPLKVATQIAGELLYFIGHTKS